MVTVRIGRLVILLALSAAAFRSAQADDAWHTDFESAQAQARQEGKDLLIFFTAAWDPHGARLEEKALGTERFEQAAREHFVLLKLDNYRYIKEKQKEKQQAVEAVFTRYGILAMPAIVLVDKDLRAYASLIGYQSGGPTTFIAQLRWMRQIRIRRDELLEKASRSVGLDRARLLDHALTTLGWGLVAAYGDAASYRAQYGNVIDEIVALDVANIAGLRGKYTRGATTPAPEDDPQLKDALLLSQSAREHFEAGRFEECLELSQQAWRQCDALMGTYYDITAALRLHVGRAHLQLGNYREAEACCWHAVNVFMHRLRSQHQSTLEAMYLLGLALKAQQRDEAAESSLCLTSQMSRENLDLAALDHSDQQQFLAAAQVRHRLDAYLSVALRRNEQLDEAYQQLLAWKGMVLARQQAVRSVMDRPELAPQFEQLRLVTAQFSRLAFASRGSTKQMEELSKQKDQLESELSSRSAEFRAALREWTVADIAGQLPPGAALVDYLEYWNHAVLDATTGKLASQRRLLAFVIRPDAEVQCVDLGESAPIADAVNTWRGSLGVSPASRAAAELLKQKVWQPLQAHLHDVSMVLVSPDGALGRFPLSLLPGNEPDRYLIEEIAIAILPAPQALPVMFADPPPRNAPNNLLVLGGVDYDADLSGPSEPVANGDKQFGRRHAIRGDEALRFEELPSTRGEAATIATLYTDVFGDQGITILRGKEASESVVRLEGPRHLYLHLATHGFFANPDLRSAFDHQLAASSRFGPELAALPGNHPGLLCGVVLAGANNPQPEGDDGILTAEEVQTLDFRACQLAVLSACETGLGEVAGGEGLLGLQRAFQVAGTRTVISSLWKVPDAATRDLMEQFYENLWNREMGTLEALREAQLWMLREHGPRAAYLLDEGQPSQDRLPPYYWGAFMLSGDWR